MSQNHLLGLVNEVLNYAKLETATVQYDLRDIAVGSPCCLLRRSCFPRRGRRGWNWW